MVTLALAKQHLEYDGEDRDDLINQYIGAAAAYIENYTGLALSVRSFTQTFDCFAPYLTLNRKPVQSLTSIAYIDADGQSQTLIGARITKRGIVPAIKDYWPETQGDVVVVYDAGLAEVPADIVSAQLLLIGHYFANREAASDRPAHEIELAVESLCRPYRDVLV